MKVRCPNLAAADPQHGAKLPLRVGRFQVRAVVGSGAFGTVYRAFDPELERDVALKVPHACVLHNSQRLERFVREARATARLRHPHIVPVYETGFDGTDHYIASAFIDGRTLAEVIRAGPMDAWQAAGIVRDLASALAHAHENGIVHRDVKPANILLDRQGQVYLMDFGLANRPDPVSLTRQRGTPPRWRIGQTGSGLTGSGLTRFGATLGTPGYMAPEIARGTTGCPPACDQYSLGVVLYELLSGRKPFEGPAKIVMYHTVRTQPPTPRFLNASVPPLLEAICLKAMAKRPEERFADCGVVAKELQHVLALQLNPGRDATRPSHLGTGAAGAAPSSRTSVVMAVAGILLLAVGMFWGMGHLLGEHSDQTAQTEVIDPTPAVPAKSNPDGQAEILALKERIAKQDLLLTQVLAQLEKKDELIQKGTLKLAEVDKLLDQARRDVEQARTEVEEEKAGRKELKKDLAKMMAQLEKRSKQMALLEKRVRDLIEVRSNPSTGPNSHFNVATATWPALLRDKHARQIGALSGDLARLNDTALGATERFWHLDRALARLNSIKSGISGDPTDSYAIDARLWLEREIEIKIHALKRW